MVADVTVVGTGIIALTAAIELADRGFGVRIVGTTHSGNASSAAGGMLAPSIGRAPGSAQDFMVASRDRYPGFVASVSERSGLRVPLSTDGIFEVVFSSSQAEAPQRSIDRPSRWVTPDELSNEEPGLDSSFGAVFHPLDGAVEPPQLLDALSSLIASHPRISTAREDCCEIRTTEFECAVLTNMENRFTSDYIVLAAGAWTPLIVGSGRPAESVAPVRGQMIAFEGRHVRRVVCGADAYLIPRNSGSSDDFGGGFTVAGGTMEHVGFDSGTTPDGIASIRERAARLCPALATAPVHLSWAGLRPITPDLLPIIGADPDRPRVIYACGHSRNGILLAPLTAEAVADIIAGVVPRHDMTRFRPGRQ